MLSLRALRSLTPKTRSYTPLTLTLNRRYSSSSSSPPHDLRINSSRFLETVHELSQLSTPKRLEHARPLPTGTSLLPPTTSLRHYLSTTLGVPALIDDLGSLFLLLPTFLRPSAPAIAIGGPLDSSPLPLLAGLEVLRTLQEHQVLTTHPITLIGWSCSSGSRFPRALLGSSVWAGLVGVEEAWGLREAGHEDLGRRTVKACLRESGWLGTPEASVQLGAYFEAVPTVAEDVGVGTGTEAWRWCDVVLVGGDALAAAGRCLLAARKIGDKHNGSVRTGVFEAQNAGFSGTVREVRFSLYIRHAAEVAVEEMEHECVAAFRSLAGEEGAIVAEVNTVMDEQAVPFDSTALSSVRMSLEDVVGATGIGGAGMVGSAGGVSVNRLRESVVREGLVGRPVDAVNTARRGVPTGVVTVPEGKGDEAWALGAQALLGAVLEWDRVQGAVGQVTERSFLSM